MGVRMKFLRDNWLVLTVILLATAALAYCAWIYPWSTQ